MTQPKLLPEPKRLWLEALRSEDYPQGVGALRTEDGYCCLGVLCEVAIKAGVEVSSIEWVGVNGEQRMSYDGCHELPPLSVTRWAFGVDHPVNDPEVEYEDEDYARENLQLTTLNDNRRVSFEGIADAIEKSL